MRVVNADGRWATTVGRLGRCQTNSVTMEGPNGLRPNTPHSVLGVIRLEIAPGSREANCLPYAIAPTSACLHDRVTANRPGILLPAFTHHPRGLVYSLLRLASPRSFGRCGPPCCFGGLVYSNRTSRLEGSGEVPLAPRGASDTWVSANVRRSIAYDRKAIDWIDDDSVAGCRRRDLNSHEHKLTTP